MFMCNAETIEELEKVLYEETGYSTCISWFDLEKDVRIERGDLIFPLKAVITIIPSNNGSDFADIGVFSLDNRLAIIDYWTANGWAYVGDGFRQTMRPHGSMTWRDAEYQYGMVQRGEAAPEVWGGEE